MSNNNNFFYFPRHPTIAACDIVHLLYHNPQDFPDEVTIDKGVKIKEKFRVVAGKTYASNSAISAPN